MTAQPIELDGEVIETGRGRVLRFVRHYGFDIAEVWSAVSEPDRMERWAFRAEYEARVGGELRFFYGDDASERGSVLAYEPPRVFEYEWTDPYGDWHVRLQLEPDGDGTTLTFDHFLPDPGRAEYAAGWHWYLDRLAALLGGAPPADVETDERFDALLAGYSGRSS